MPKSPCRFSLRFSSTISSNPERALEVAERHVEVEGAVRLDLVLRRAIPIEDALQRVGADEEAGHLEQRDREELSERLLQHALEAEDEELELEALGERGVEWACSSSRAFAAARTFTCDSFLRSAAIAESSVVMTRTMISATPRRLSAAARLLLPRRRCVGW